MVPVSGRRLIVPALALALLSLGMPQNSWAQKKKGGPPQPTGAPALNFPMPLGVQPGVAQELILTGTNLVPAAQLWTGFPAKVTFLDDDKLAGEGKVKLSLTTPANTPLGLYPIRLLAAGGVSNTRLFAVDDLPPIVDNDANHDRAKPQEIPVPCVVAGKTEAEVSDYYKIKASAGQRLSFEILGRRLGSPIDPLIALYDGKTLREIAHDNDSPGCQGDPRLSFTFKDAGDYVIEVRDVLGRGGADYVYRLRIGDFPLAVAPVPMAARAGSKVRVEFAGPHVDGVKPVDVAVPNVPAGSVVWVAPKANGTSGWPVALVVSDVDEGIAKGASPKSSQPTPLPIPGGATGRFLPGHDPDQYLVSLKKGQKITVEAQTLEWGSPSLVYLVIKKAKGSAEVAKSNPAGKPFEDQRFEFTSPEDGDFLIEVQHLLYHVGPSEVYHLSVRPSGGSFDVILASDKAESAAGGIAVVPFQVVRTGGFAGPIDLQVRGDKSISAKVTDKQTAGVLLIPSKDDAPLAVRTVEVEATAMIDGKPVTILAHAKPTVTKALADLVFPPADLPTSLAVAIKEKAPFTLSAKLEPGDAVPGTAPNVLVTATRDPGFDVEIAINPIVGLPANVGAKVVPIAKGKNETKFPLDVNAKAALGEYYLLISGKAKQDKREIISDPALLRLVVGAPLDLAVEPMSISIAPGEKTKLTIKATRKHGYKGPIAIEVKNLPAKITGGKATIAAEKNDIEIELAAAPDAPAGETPLEIVGIATGMNNLAGSAPAVPLRIAKK